jgi:peptidoglycan/LPS O-acetylase OafA/YrhL
MYSGANFNHVTGHVGNALSVKDFVGNMAFLQTIVVPAFGSNGSLWSLANEFWYYILFPLAACVLGRVYKKAAQVALCGLLLCGLVISLQKAILFLFPVWLLGAALHAIGTKPTALWPRLVASLVYAVVFLGAAILDRRGWGANPAIRDFLFGIATFCFIWVLLGAKREAKHTTLCRLARAVARFSFTLYVAHLPILTFLAALMLHDTRWLPTMKTGGLALAALVFVVGYAWLLATVTEFKTDQVRAWVEGKVMHLA